MSYNCEIINNTRYLPIKLFIHSVDNLNTHFHNEVEIILVLKGSLDVRIKDQRFLLKENDLVVINSNEVHSSNKTNEENIILLMNIDTRYYSKYHLELSSIKFDYDYLNEDQSNLEKFDKIKNLLANIAWKLNQEPLGFQLSINGKIQILLAHLINNFEYTVEGENVLSGNNLTQDIIKYIDDNLESGVTLNDIADKKQLSVSHLSRYIKKNIGISFQDYLNNIRMDKATNLLVKTNSTITQISYKSGLPSTKSLNQLFRKIHNCTPTEYREKYQGGDNRELVRDNKGSEMYLDAEREEAFKKLLTYIKPTDMERSYEAKTNYKQQIAVSNKTEGVSYKPYWRKVTTLTRAADGLKTQVQDQLKVLQREIGFEYLRVHGIFCDEMMVYNVDGDGEITYKWSHVDELFDLLMSVNIKPFVELSIIPYEVTKSDEIALWWNENMSQPKATGIWIKLMKELVKHLVNRYGLKEVESWYFEVWSEPELEGILWVSGQETYFKLYEYTVDAVKSVSSKLRVGGPSISYRSSSVGNWFEDFLIYSNENKIYIDFLSINLYPEHYSNTEEIMEALSGVSGGNVEKIYFEQKSTQNSLIDINKVMRKHLDYEPELHIMEWNVLSYGRNLIHDTSFAPSLILICQH